MKILLDLLLLAACGADKRAGLVDDAAIEHRVPDARADMNEQTVPVDDAASGSGFDTPPLFSSDAAPWPRVDTATSSPWPSSKYISVDDVYARLQAQDPEMLLVNVVDVQFYDLGFIAGSLKIPWDTLADRLDELDPARHIVLYCRKGVRSESAYTTLRDKGFPLVWVMEGGIERWIAAGYPTVKE